MSTQYAQIDNELTCFRQDVKGLGPYLSDLSWGKGDLHMKIPLTVNKDYIEQYLCVLVG